MTIKELIEQGEGKAHNWKVVKPDTAPGDGDLRELYHHSTRMLTWNHTTKEVIDWDLGHGSKSDQDGMNIAFQVLGSKYYYSRKGGAAIRE